MTKPSAQASDTRVLLVGWAGADWRGVDPHVNAGRMPATQALIEEGVRGRLAPVRPLVSPMLWTSAVTGKRADKHGVCSFYEPTSANTGLTPVSGLQRRSAAIWHCATSAGLESVVVGWPVVDPAEPILGTIVADAPAVSDSEQTPGPLVAGLCDKLRRLCVDPERLDPLLGWVLRLHAIACELAEGDSWRLASVCYPVLAGWVESFNSGQSESATTEEWFDCAWRLQDALLAELRQAAGSEVNLLLISPHGPIRSSASSSDLDSSGSSLGLFCASGPQFRSGITHYGATVLDVAPTVLRVLGLVEDDETDGEPWLDCLDLGSARSASRERGRQPSLASAKFASQPQPEPPRFAKQVSPADEASCLQVRENQRANLALALSDSDRFRKAIPLWRELLKERPGSVIYAAWLVECLGRDGQDAEVQRVVEGLPPEIAEQPTFQLALAEIAAAGGRLDQAALLATNQSIHPNTTPGLLVRAARVLTACGDYAAAESLYARSVDCDGGRALAHAGLADLHWERDDVDRSVAEAREALTIAPALTEARFTLARSLHRIGQKPEAIAEFERCLKERWRPEDAHSYLASLYWSDDPVRASYHREMAGIA